MAQILFIATSATEDPNRATFPFLMARGAVENGDQPEILLMGEGTNLARTTVLESIVAAGPPPLRDIWPAVKAAGVPLYVWTGCARARGVTEADLGERNAQFVDPKQAAALMTKAERVVTF